MGAAWEPAGPERFRLSAGAVLSPAVAESSLQSVSTPSVGAAALGSAIHPDNPLVVWGLLGALTFGLMAFSTSGSVRVGKTTATAGLGIGSTK